MRSLRATASLLGLLLAACATHFTQAGLANLTPGWTKGHFLAYFSRPKIEPPILRAAKSDGAGVIEVFTLDLARSDGTEPTPFWFVFQNGLLRQWGRPEDWAQVAATYNVNFNPAPRVMSP